MFCRSRVVCYCPADVYLNSWLRPSTYTAIVLATHVLKWGPYISYRPYNAKLALHMEPYMDLILVVASPGNNIPLFIM
jgi:hypothetical protein